MTLATGLATLKTASDLAVRIREALNSREVKLDEVLARVIEIQELILEGRGALIDAQEQLFSKNEELDGFRRQIHELQAAAAKTQDLTFMHGVYWRAFDIDRGEMDHEGNAYVEVHYSGPFCPTCYDADAKAVRMRDMGDYDSGKGRFYCDIHGIEFSVIRMDA
jgi:hypothetical protein